MKKKINKLDPKNWEHSTPEQLKAYKKGIEKKLGVKLGRPFIAPELKYVAISIKLDPVVLKKFKAKAKKTGKPYQTLINEALKKAA
mgnify:CR=1 FL=1